MADNTMIIIGGGLAGLSTGCYAQMNGYQARIFEQHTQPGGVCTAWKRKGYTIDGCIHWLMGCQPGTQFRRIYDELGAFTGGRLHTLDHYTRFLDEATGQRLEITSDLDRLAGDMKAISPCDAPAIETLVGGARALRDVELPLMTPRALMGPLDGVKTMWQMRRAISLARRHPVPVATFAKQFQDAFLRRCVTDLFVPDMPTHALMFVLGHLSSGQLGRPEGGSLEFARAIAARFEGLGGEITYGAPVAEILVENDRAAGVRLEDGSTHRAGVVVSAADGHATLFDMLGGRYLDAKTRERYETWPLFPPLLFVSFGVARDFPDEPAGNILLWQSPPAAGKVTADCAVMRLEDNDVSVAPEGKSVVQLLFVTEFDYWQELAGDRPRYEAEKQRVADAALAMLERRYPGISALVEMTDVATPHTLWRYTRNYRAAFEGWLMTPQTFAAEVPKTLPGLGRFTMAGQWVEPGGGVPPALASGRNVVRLLCREDGKRFVTTEA